MSYLHDSYKSTLFVLNGVEEILTKFPGQFSIKKTIRESPQWISTEDPSSPLESFFLSFLLSSSLNKLSLHFTVLSPWDSFFGSMRQEPWNPVRHLMSYKYWWLSRSLKPVSLNVDSVFDHSIVMPMSQTLTNNFELNIMFIFIHMEPKVQWW